VAVEVYERAPELGEVGAGLSLWANALHALDRLGVGEAIRRRGLPGTAGAIRTWRGETLLAPSADRIPREWGVVVTAVHRADLQATLRAALEPGVVRLGAECTGFAAEGAGVRARFADGRQADGDLLIGADGLGSVTRARLFGDTPPRYSGYTAWRGITAGAAPRPDSAFESWGRGRRFGAVPLLDGRVYWFATRNAPPGEPESPAGRTAELLSEFRGWHAPIEALIEATPGAAVLRNDIYDRPPLRRWGEGRITLLGDAAHPMTPNLGQGACQALEDAVVLGDCLRGTADVAGALRTYEARRRPRTTTVVERSWRIGRMGQWEHPVACWLRNAAVRAAPAGLHLRQLASIIGHRV
jgi:2-polyprenyl-6-methoxyphenol hydroxylase-like FAD-dependent oxidoreductase